MLFTKMMELVEDNRIVLGFQKLIHSLIHLNTCCYVLKNMLRAQDITTHGAMV